MDQNEKINQVIQNLDNETRMLKGEWTTDGRKLFLFEITEKSGLLILVA